MFEHASTQTTKRSKFVEFIKINNKMINNGNHSKESRITKHIFVGDKFNQDKKYFVYQLLSLARRNALICAEKQNKDSDNINNARLLKRLKSYQSESAYRYPSYYPRYGLDADEVFQQLAQRSGEKNICFKKEVLSELKKNGAIEIVKELKQTDPPIFLTMENFYRR